MYACAFVCIVTECYYITISAIPDSNVHVKQETNNNNNNNNDHSCGLSPLSGAHIMTSRTMDAKSLVTPSSGGGHGDLSFLPTPESSPNTGLGRGPSPHMHGTTSLKTNNNNNNNSYGTIPASISSSLQSAGNQRLERNLTVMYSNPSETGGMSHSTVAVGAC